MGAERQEAPAAAGAAAAQDARQLAELKRHQRNALANRAEIDEILGLGGRDGD